MDKIAMLVRSGSQLSTFSQAYKMCTREGVMSLCTLFTVHRNERGKKKSFFFKQSARLD